MKTNYSAQRQLIIKVLKESKDHPSAESIYEKCKKLNSKIGKATVYRNLAMLEKSNDLIKVSGAIGKERYDGDTSMHGHIICPICGEIWDVEVEEKLKNVLNVELENNKYSNVQITYYKTCENCKK